MSTDLTARPATPSTDPQKRPNLRIMAAVAVVAAAAAAVYLAAAPMGIDLAAQTAYADFWVRHGAAALNFGWYGGVSPFGYSLVTPELMGWLGGGTTGARALGAIAAVTATLLLAALLIRTHASRPLLAALLGAVGVFGNIVSGRVTFTAGLVFALGALLALTWSRPWRRRTAAVVGGVLAAATSPVVGLFTGLAGVALLLAAGWRRSENPGFQGRRVDGLLLATAAAVPTLGMAALFGAGGPMNTIGSDTLRSCTVSLLVALLVPRPAIRIGALLSAAGVVAASILTTPVGLNAGRLSATFALAILAGYATRPALLRVPFPASRAPRTAAVAVLVGAVAIWQHPVSVSDLRSVGDPTSSPAYFAPLLDELARDQPQGRVEVVPTVHYWEAAYVPGTAPLARGWLRQADTVHNAVFFHGRLTASSYLRWLKDTGVSLVALADAPSASVAGQEAALVRSRQSYLRKIWHSEHWTLYAVAGAPAIVAGATLVSGTDGAVVLDVTSPGSVSLKVRWSRWLAVTGPDGCLAPAAEGWTALTARLPGRYTVTGSLVAGPRC
ncbi:hypothetical protein [Krasilnikovia sp. MM14-A1259]|uniref:hypothetical protein n=1 Tax=Krasilnikovia sp. MM14-A1259 TaxID=3373539 RepID=UPI0037F7346B